MYTSIFAYILSLTKCNLFQLSEKIKQEWMEEGRRDKVRKEKKRMEEGKYKKNYKEGRRRRHQERERKAYKQINSYVCYNENCGSKDRNFYALNPA